jgi:hypothetical protein
MESTTTKLQPTHRTRSGLMAGIYSTDNGGSHPVHAWIACNNDAIICVSLTKDLQVNQSAGNTDYDLFPLPKKIKVEGWVNVYEDYSSKPHKTKESADKSASRDRIACKFMSFEVEEGEGL